MSKAKFYLPAPPANRRLLSPLSHAHDVLTAFLEKHGFQVTRHHLLETAWVATFTRGDAAAAERTLGINSEMDALPGIGHACGHNLIAIAGVAVACAVKAAMDKFGVSGSIVLLGTPGASDADFFAEKGWALRFTSSTGEEGGSGKVLLLEKGAYEGMDACLMYASLSMNPTTC